MPKIFTSPKQQRDANFSTARSRKSPFIKRTEELLKDVAKDYDFNSFRMSLEEEQTSRLLVQKANMLKNNLGTGFVNRRKAQLVGSKLLAALRKDSPSDIHFRHFQSRIADLSEGGGGSTKRGTNSPSVNTQYHQEFGDQRGMSLSMQS